MLCLILNFSRTVPEPHPGGGEVSSIILVLYCHQMVNSVIVIYTHFAFSVQFFSTVDMGLCKYLELTYLLIV